MIAGLLFFVNVLTVISTMNSPPPLTDPLEEYDLLEPIAAQRLQRFLLHRRGPDIVKPRRNSSTPVEVKFKMELYQIIELNERQQYVAVSVWVIERWYDELLYWNPADFDNITETKMHHSNLWIPDTTLYNTLVMKDDDQRRLLHVKVTTDWEKKRALIEFLYPAIYKFYCRLYLQFFPFDSQTCHMIFGSWTSDNRDIDYVSLAKEIGTSNYMPNEGWSIMGTSENQVEAVGTSSFIPNDEWELLSTTAQRVEVKYVCCAFNYTLLDFTLYLRRRPLFYLVNLVIPTFIITLIAITGFFTTSSTTGVREEKISLCITTLLSMSILMLMVSDQMPSTSTFIPLISWFYMCAIVIISVGALAASFVISVQKFGSMGQRLPRRAVRIARVFSFLSITKIPDHLQPKDRLLEFAKLYGFSPEKMSLKERKSMDACSRKSTISQFAKYIFTAGTDLPGFYDENVWRQQVLDALLGRVPPSYGAFRQSGVCNGYPTANGCPQSMVNENRRKDARGSHHMEDASVLRNNNCVEAEKRRNHSTVSDVFEDEKMTSTRRLARIEYDWLATVIERCTFLVFLFTFLVMSLGINFLGMVHWLNSSPPPEATLVTISQ